MRTIKVLAIAGLLAGGMAVAQTQAELQKQAKITMDAAKATALAAAPGKVKSGEIEKEKGKLIYSFDILSKGKLHEVNVDAMTGKVIENKIESKAEEAKEAAADKAAADKAATK